MFTRRPYSLCALALLLAAACGEDRGGASGAGAARSGLIMAPGWVAGSGWPAETVVALSSVQLQSASSVIGDVAVITASSPPFLSTENAVLANNVELRGNIKANSLRLLANAHVFGTAGYNTLFNAGMIDGALGTPLSLPLPITVPTVPNFSAGTTNVTVAAGATQTLAAGSYNLVTLNAGTASAPTTLTLSGGVYAMQQLTQNNWSRVQCSAACEIRIKGQLQPGANSYLGPSGPSGLLISAVQLIVEGTNTGSGPNGSPFAADIGATSELKAFTFVPNGTLNLGAGSMSVGKFLARDVNLASGAGVQEGTGIVQLPDPWLTGPRWPSELLTAFNSTQLTGSARFTGDVSVLRIATGATLVNGFEAVVGNNSVLTGSLRGDTVNVRTGAVVTGSVSYNGLTNAGTIQGGQITPLAMPLAVTVPPFPSFSAGTTGVNVPASADQTLAAGSYGLIQLQAGVPADKTVLTLTGGVYNVADLNLGNYGRLECAAACELRVKNRIITGGNSYVGQAASSGLEPADIRIFVQGKNGGQGNPLSTPMAAVFGQSGAVNAYVFVPNGTLSLAANVSALGRVVGKDVQINDGGAGESPPRIVQQPANLTVTEGQSAAFSCSSTGTTPAYRWQKNGVDIAGATSATYTISATAYTDAANYRCKATTAAGSVFSDNAALVVDLLPPQITQHPANQTVTEGESAGFTCAASGTLVSYQWQKDGVAIPGATSATYSIAAAAYTQAGSYRCVATNGLPPQTGGGSATSNAATLVVNLIPPTITSNPANVTVTEGQSASFSCAASGTLVGYQWQKDGVDISGATAATYTIAATTYDHAGSYRCVAANGLPPQTGGGSAASTAATLRVDLIAPVITTEPVNRTVTEGQSASFSCAASGTLVQYQWQKDGVDVPGATAATFTIASTAYTDAGAYRCVARNDLPPQTGGGTATSNAAILTVNLATPAITTNPANLTVTEGDSASFSCAASGSLVHYQWQKDGVDVPGATDATFTIASTAYTDAGAYRCVATNGFVPQTGGGSTTSAAATLTVDLLAPVITADPSDLTVSEGASASFSCQASGTLVHYQWQRGGQDIPGATSSTYTIAATTLSDAGGYRCVASNGLPPQTGGGSVTSSTATLTVNAIGTVITQNPSDVTTTEGQSASFSCAASGTSVHYQWQKDDVDIEGATGATYTIVATAYTDAGGYRCVAHLEAGGASATSATATLVVNLIAPAITSDPSDLTVAEGQPASFTCAASGTQVHYQWQKDGVDIVGATVGSYTITAATYDRAGEYRCVARNGIAPQTGGGTAISAAAALRVDLLAPTITSNPADATVHEGQSASFSCAASGTLVRYQWQKDGVDIAGATAATYTIAATAYTHAGAYRCVARNGLPPQTGGGTATSAAATLTVNLLAPAITDNPANLTVPEGQPAQFSCAASGTLVHYQWQKDGVDIAGATAAAFTIASTAYTDAGAYRCVAHNGVAPQTGGGTATSTAATLQVDLIAPAITLNPANVSVREGQPASFTCAASGTLVHYQWQKDGFDIAGALAATYTIAAVSTADQGAYRCIATNGLPPQTGGGSATSAAATLTVSLNAPIITENPTDLTVTEGDSASFTCAASGTSVQYQWQKDGQDIAGATAATYTIVAAAYTNEGSYRCVASNDGVAGGGSATSAAATLTVSLVAPVITQNPTNVTVSEGGTASFSCAASGTLVHYQWQKDGQDIAGATAATYTIAAAVYTDVGSYSCVARNGLPPQSGGGSASSSAASLRVNLLAPVISSNPVDVTVSEGQAASFSCAASGTLVHYQWQKDGIDIAGATAATYAISSTLYTDAGAYRCVASNGLPPQTGGGSATSAAATLTVNLLAPVITASPQDLAVTEGQAASFSCAASGTLVHYQWQKDGVDIAGATGATYTLASTAYSHAGAYRCVASNGSPPQTGGGSATSAPASLTVNLLAPVITDSPNDRTVTEGQSASFSCAASGTLVHYQWQKDGEDITGATSATFSIAAATYLDAGLYRCVASNGSPPQTGGGSATSAPATLTVNLIAPTITDNPTSVTVVEGASASFSCAASGTLVHYQWQKDGEDIGGATSATYTIASTSYADAGNYRCVARNGLTPQTGGGSASSTAAVLRVDLIAPAITTDPAALNVTEGQPAQFTCAASGTLVHYQWQKDGENIPGATGASYAIAAASYSDAGSYRCIASNGQPPQTGGGTVTSTAAALIVNLVAPVITINPADLTVTEGQAASFTCAATGTLVHYQWQKDGVDIPGANTATYPIASAAYTHAGSYRCVVTNGVPPQTGGGTATSSPATLVVDLIAPIITDNPNDLTVAEGDAATFTCAASGTLVHYQWQKDDVDIPGATSTTYSIAATAYTHAGAYRCIARNGIAPQTGGGSATSSAAILRVNLAAPVITASPANVTTTEGQSASFACAASGTLVQYQWQKDGQDIAGATSPTYSLATTVYGDAGTYRCVARNGIAPQTGGGTATSAAATLIVNLIPPAITSDPSDLTVTEGSPASFTCAASGTLVQYQWQKDGVDIAGATSATYSIAVTSYTHAGAYRCVASNGLPPQTGGGSAISAGATLRVNLIPPTITTNPTSATVDEGQSVSFTCAASGTLVHYQWQKDAEDISGATSATYSIASAAYFDAGSYRCVASNGTAPQTGGGSAISTAASLVVNLFGPVITTSPSDVHVTEGQPASFTCAASGTEIHYQWQKDGVDIAGASSPTYAIAAAAYTHAGSYRCVVTNGSGQSGGTTTSSAASLVVDLIAPAITTQPANATVTEGQSTSFTCAASGTLVHYQWQKDGADIPGATSATYSIASAAYTDVGAYRCVATNGIAPQTGGGTASSNTASLVVDLIPPTISTQPANATVTEGQSASFTCAAGGSLVHFQWQKDGVDIAGAIAATYSIASAAYTHAGTYRCIATNGVPPQTGGGSATSNGATLRVDLIAPVITASPASLTVTEGQSASFTCAASGTLVHYQWQKDGADILGATSFTFSIANVADGDAGSYRCVATNGVPPQTGGGTTASSAATLTVNLIAPVITQHPSNVTVDEGQPFSLTCAASGSRVTYQWEQDLMIVPGATSPTYSVASARLSDAGSYRCFAFNSGGGAGSNAATVTVRLNLPVITQQPQNVSVAPGQSASFSCAASGTAVSYRWQKDDVDIPGATSQTYTIAAASAGHVGSYRCIATNSRGSATSNAATLTLSPAAPTIAQQPADVTVAEGQSFTLTVQAIGYPLNYQWQRNGAAVPGATSASYTKQAVASDDGAQYRVVVSNALGTVTSNTASITLHDDVGPTLTVNVAPTLTVSGDTLHITGTAVDNAPGATQTTVTNDRYPGQSYGVVAGSDGNFAGDVPLAVGTNVLTVTVTDGQGNSSTYTITVTVQATSLPRITIVAPAAGAVVTAERISVTGYVRSTLPPDQIRLRLADQVVFPTGSDQQYAFEFTNVPLLLGGNQLQVDAETDYGTVSAQLIVTRVEVAPPTADVPPPVIELAIAQPRIVTTATSVPVSGVVRAQTCVESVTVNGGAATVHGSGMTVSFDRTLTFPAGASELLVTVVATDCNHRTAQASYTLVHDDGPPLLTLDAGLSPSPAVNSVVQSPYRLTGTVHDAQLAGITVNDASVYATPAGPSGDWSFAFDVPLQRDVDVPVTVDAWDLANQHTVRSVLLRYDAARDLAILVPRNGSTIPVSGSSTSLDVTAQASGLLPGDQVTASFDGAGSVQLALAGEYASATLHVPATSGSHTLVLTARTGDGSLLASATAAFTMENASDIPLELVRQEPAADAVDVEANSSILLTFNRPVDPTQLEVRVVETAHGKIYSSGQDGDDMLTQSAVATQQIDRELEPVPGNAQNLPGDTSMVFYPSRDFAYGGTVYVEVLLNGTQVAKTRFGVRSLPTLVYGFVSDQNSVPLQGIQLELLGTARTAATDADGNWSFGFGETPAKMLSAGRYRAVINPGLRNPRYGSVETFVTVATGDLNYAGVTPIPVINTAEPFAHVSSRQGAPAVLASGDLTLDLTQAELAFPNGQTEGDIHVQFMKTQEIGYRSMGSALPDWGFAVQPIAVTVTGSIGITAALPLLEGSYDYLEEVPDRVLIVGVDPDTLLLAPVGVGRLDRESHRLVSEGRVPLRRLDYVGMSSLRAGLSPSLLNSYVAKEITLAELINALESR